jgi:uncharacterized protein RhaS with RHS repeats
MFLLKLETASDGLFLSRDPIGFRGGDTNLYGYVVNDPINHMDPSGLSVATGLGKCAGGAVLAIMGGIAMKNDPVIGIALIGAGAIIIRSGVIDIQTSGSGGSGGNSCGPSGPSGGGGGGPGVGGPGGSGSGGSGGGSGGTGGSGGGGGGGSSGDGGSCQ